MIGKMITRHATKKNIPSRNDKAASFEQTSGRREELSRFEVSNRRKPFFGG